MKRICAIIVVIVLIVVIIAVSGTAKKDTVCLNQTIDAAIQDTLARIKFQNEHDEKEEETLGVELGFFTHSKQRPQRLIKSLPSQAFFTDEEIPEMKVLRDNYAVIRNELEQLINIGRKTFRDVPDPIYRKNMWKQFLLYSDGKPIPTNTSKCPETTKIVEQFKNATSLTTTSMIGFSNIYPGTHITPHTGFSNDRVRIHLGLIVPDNCFLTVGDDVVQWKEGETIAFSDSFIHSVQNKSDENRYILIVDVWNPHMTKEQIEFEKELHLPLREATKDEPGMFL